MKRAETENKYKWRLEDIYASDADWEIDFDCIKRKYKQIEDFKGQLGKADKLLECLRLQDGLSADITKLYVYAMMRKDEDGRVDKYVGMTDRIAALANDFSAASSFVGSEISALDEAHLSAVINRPDFADFDYTLKEISRKKKYILSDKEERLLAMSGKALGGYQDAFMILENVDLPLPTLKINGEKAKLTHGKYSYYLSNGEPKTRKAVFEGMYGAIKKVVNTTAVLYSNSVKADNFYSEARGHDSSMEAALYQNDVPMKVYDNLVRSVRKGQKAMHEYVALRKKTLGLPVMHVYDMYVPIVKSVNMSVPYEDAYQLVLEGLKPMGQEYRNLLLQAKNEGWIDVCENEGKRSGAYSCSCYKAHPFVLLNYSRTTHDIFTIAHEMGHALHSYYSNLAQPHSKHNYQIFVAEVASTVNEVLLIKHLLKTAKDRETRMFLLNYYLDMFRTTMFRQTMFAEFEMLTHDMESKGYPLTVASLSDKYYALNKKYYGNALRHDSDIKYEWARIPHFYSAFYVYQYATGITSAINIVKKILTDESFYQTYKDKFLSAGGSDSPYLILKNTGVDLAATEPFEVAMNEFDEVLHELKRELE
ncbi:MAG: oligoendopeptidase F [Firmicutes bacterium]|nr:oligoendopeptidase F [Bacillota bacterium]